MAAPDTDNLPFKAIIFDCFGVLYVEHKAAFLATVVPEKQRDIIDAYKSSDYGYTSGQQFIARMKEITGFSEDEILRLTHGEPKLNTELMTIVEDLRKDYKVGLLSNIGYDRMQDFFTDEQLEERFDAVVLSGREGVAKPNPAIFELMAERLGLHPGDCLMIDDIAENCEGADIAGMRSIHFTSNKQLMDDLYATGTIH